MSDCERRIVSDLNTTYLSAEAMADIERLGIELVEGAPLTVCDYDADENGNPTWVVAEGVAQFDVERQAGICSTTTCRRRLLSAAIPAPTGGTQEPLRQSSPLAVLAEAAVGSD